MTRISTVIFDLDGTLVRYHGVEFESSWGAVASAAGVHDRSVALMREYFPRRDDYDEWVRKEAELYAGIRVSTVTDRVLPAPYAAGVVEAVATLRNRYRLGILSSGVDLVAEWVRKDLGFSFAVANRLGIEDGRFTGESETQVELWAKDEAMKRVAAEHDLPLEEICYVGDHVNDLPVMRLVGLPIAANPKDPEVRDACRHVIEDFSELPELIEAFAAGP